MDYEKKYKEALETARKINSGEGVAAPPDWTSYEVIFPELKESKDEKIRKELIEHIKSNCEARFLLFQKFSPDDVIAWLEKQRTSNEAIKYLEENHSPSEISDFQAAMNIAVAKAYDKGKRDAEKQGEQLYIRFGKIPDDEKSKIFRGDIEIGTENGVSVYPAFETNNGDIVLGLNLPITKTTLHTQQHLLEYDNRPCYLVKGNYIGKDTDGQPLIDNISIIRKIDNYRIKEEKVDNQNCVKSADKVEPKFEVGDWITDGNCKCQITFIDSRYWYSETCVLGDVKSIDKKYHLWTIADAKDGDVLYSLDSNRPFIYKERNGYEQAKAYCGINIYGKFFVGNTKDCIIMTDKYIPATKEQCDLLFSKMREAGWEWDEEKKELKKNVEPKFHEGDWITNGQLTCKVLSITSKSYELHLYNDDYCHFETDVQRVDKQYHLWTVQDAKDGDVLTSINFHSNCTFIFNGLDNWKFDEPNGDRAVATGYCCLSASADKMEFGIQGPDCVEINTIKPATKIQRDLLSQKMKEAGYEWDAEKKVLKKIQQLSAWSEEDDAYKLFTISAVKDYYDENNPLQKNLVEWLKSLKERIE